MTQTKNPSLRVCQLISSFRPVIGGAERATERLTVALRGRGVDAVVLTRRKTKNDAYLEEIEGLPVYHLGTSDHGKWGASTFGLHGCWLLSSRFRDYDIVHVQSPDTPLLIGFLVKMFLKKRLVVTIHGESRILELAAKFWGRLRLKIMVRLVDRFTSISPEITTQLERLGVSPSRIDPIPNGMDTSMIAPPAPLERKKARGQVGLGEKGVAVIFIGRLVDWKRVDLLLRAWARLSKQPGDALLIVGGGPELELLKGLAAQLQVEVRFEGPKQDVLPYLRAADVFVLPSGIRSRASFEGLSVALMEAMSAGLAVIASDCPGNRALVTDGENGLLFPVEEDEALANQLARLLADSGLRARLGARAREDVVHDYAIEAVAQKTETLYRQLQSPAIAS
jgi:glycosyltransferase involved in cell wall biosynthesis